MIIFRESVAELDEVEKPFCPKVNEKGAQSAVEAPVWSTGGAHTIRLYS